MFNLKSRIFSVFRLFQTWLTHNFYIEFKNVVAQWNSVSVCHLFSGTTVCFGRLLFYILWTGDCLGVYVPAHAHTLPISSIFENVFMFLGISTCGVVWIRVNYFVFKSSETQRLILFAYSWQNWARLLSSLYGRLHWWLSFYFSWWLEPDGVPPNFLPGLERIRLWAHESVYWLWCVYRKTAFLRLLWQSIVFLFFSNLGEKEQWMRHWNIVYDCTQTSGWSHLVCKGMFLFIF